MTEPPAALAERARTYPPGPGTEPERADWTAATPPGFRRHESTVRIGAGESDWAAAVAAVLAWGVKTRSGFAVSDGPNPVTAGARYRVRARIGPLTVVEPVEVVRVVVTSARTGFAYGTLDGHPVSGEEAFVVHRDAAGTVFLTLRSLTGPAPSGPWSRVFPLIRLVQLRYRRRYHRALRRR